MYHLYVQQLTYSLFSRLWPHTTVAVPPGAADRQVLSGIHIVDRRWLGIQADRPRRGGTPVGHPQEQTEDELRETLQGTPVLLRQEHHTQDRRQTICLSVRLRPAEPFGVRGCDFAYFFWWNNPHSCCYLVVFLTIVFKGKK